MSSKQNNPTLFGLIHLIAAPGKHAHVFRGFLFTLVLGCLCALPATANAQALVQTTGAVTTTAQLTLTANYAGTPVNGHLLVAVVATRNTETTVTLTSPGATNPSWTGVSGNDFSGLAPGHGIFYRVTGAVETTNVTVTVVPTSTLIAIQIYEFSGIDTANPVYNFNSNFGGADPELTDDILPDRTPYLAVATFGINTSSNAGNFNAFTNTGTNTQAWIQQADQKAGDMLEKIYRQMCVKNPPVQRMNLVSAELTKISVNTYVTTKISYANMLADICDRLPGADVDVVTRALGADTRIGLKYLKGAMGYGGPCFPRDNVAFAALARKIGARADVAEATDRINNHQVERLANLVAKFATGSLTSRPVAQDCRFSQA